MNIDAKFLPEASSPILQSNESPIQLASEALSSREKRPGNEEATPLLSSIEVNP
jgi:hypothetical protein